MWQELERVLTPMLAGFRSRWSPRVEQKADADAVVQRRMREVVQAEIIRCVRAVDPDGVILGEEGAHGPDLLRGRGLSDRRGSSIRSTGRLSSSTARAGSDVVVCLVEGKRPVAAFVLAPRSVPTAPGPVRMLERLRQAIEINGKQAASPARWPRPGVHGLDHEEFRHAGADG